MTDAEYGAEVRLALRYLDIPVQVMADALTMSRFQLRRRLDGAVPFSAWDKKELDKIAYVVTMLRDGDGSMGLAEQERLRELADAFEGVQPGLSLDLDDIIQRRANTGFGYIIKHLHDKERAQDKRREEEAAQAEQKRMAKQRVANAKRERREAERAAAARARELERQRAAKAKRREAILSGESARIRRGYIG